MPNKQVVTIGKKAYPVSYGINGPTITGVFTPEQKRYITNVYGVTVISPSEGSKSSSKNEYKTTFSRSQKSSIAHRK